MADTGADGRRGAPPQGPLDAAGLDGRGRLPGQDGPLLPPARRAGRGPRTPRGAGPGRVHDLPRAPPLPGLRPTPSRAGLLGRGERRAAARAPSSLAWRPAPRGPAARRRRGLTGAAVTARRRRGRGPNAPTAAPPPAARGPGPAARSGPPPAARRRTARAAPSRAASRRGRRGRGRG